MNLNTTIENPDLRSAERMARELERERQLKIAEAVSAAFLETKIARTVRVFPAVLRQSSK